MKNWNFFIKIAIIVFIIFGIVTTVQLGVRISDLQDQVGEASEQIDALNDDIAELIDEIEKPIDQEYIYKIARESLNYHFPSEIVFYNDMAK